MLLKTYKINGIEISVVDNEEKYEKVKLVEPNIIYNRLDIRYNGNFDLLKIKYKDKEQYIAYHVKPNGKAYIGIYMTSLEQCVFDKILKFIIKRHKNIKYLRVKHGRIKHRDLLNEMQWTIHLPNTVEEYNAQLSGKTRNTRRRKLKKLNESYEVIFEHYDKPKINKELIERFFELKKSTEDNIYYKSDVKGINLMLSDYYDITDAFVIKVNGIIEAIELCSAIGDKDVQFINVTYNKKYSYYGLGIMAYYYAIEYFIEQGYKAIYLGGFYYDYKRESRAVITETMKGDIVCSTPLQAVLRFIFSKRKRVIYSNKEVYKEKIITIFGIRFIFKIKMK